MNEILHANIFFLIASVATVCFCVLLSIALYHVIKILRSIRAIIAKIEMGSERLAEDVADLRATIMEGGIVSRLFGFVFGRHDRVKPKRKRVIIKKPSI